MTALPSYAAPHRRYPIRPALVLSLVLAVTLAPAAAAQSGSTPETSWTLSNLSPSFCLEFLMDSTAARKDMPAGVEPQAARRFAGLSPVLTGVIERQPEFAGWIPAEVCLLSAPVIQLDNRPLTDKEDQIVAYWSIAATEPGAATDRPVVFIRRLMSTNWRVERAAERALLDVRTIRHELGKVPESPMDRLMVRIEKTTLTWDGRMDRLRDSTRMTAPRQRRWVLEGRRGSDWWADADLAMGWEMPVPGSLRVAGKDDLAKALQASPIRMFGPMYWGGEARFAFWRRPK